MTDNLPPAAPGPDTYPVYEDEVPPHHLGRRGRVLSWVLGIGALVLLALLAYYLAHHTAASQGAGGGRRGGGAAGGRGGPGGGGMNAPTTVGTAKAASADLPVVVEALGTVTPAATVTVIPQVSGTITELLYREGQMVRKGQTLAIIDPRPYRAALLQAQGALLRDQAQLENARVQLKRYQLLLSQDSIARQDTDTQAALAKQLQGTVDIDRGQVQVAQINLGYTRVIAPVSGRVGLKAVDVGNYIGAGTTTGIAVVTTLSPIDVEFSVPQDQAPAIAKRVAAGAEIPATALDRTRVTTLDTGRFSTLDNRVDTSTGTIKGKARFANAGGQLYPSQFVNVRLTVDTVRNAITVPPAAVRSGQDGNFVWLFKDDRTVTERKIVTGVTTADKVQIVSGLALNDVVITDGGDRLTEGGKVRLPTDKLPPPPKASGGGWFGLGGSSAGTGGRHRRHGGEAGNSQQSDTQTAPANDATPATPTAAPAAQPAPNSPTARRPRTAEAPPAATASVAAPQAGTCPKPPEGLDPDARHQWFRDHMATMSDDQRAACRAQREKMRAERGGGQGDGGGQGG
jgi:multidrug efflux system membrane fusion protein